MTQLCLSRKVNETIIIGDGLIEIAVHEIRGDRVRLIIRAPRELSVHRSEVHEAIQRKKAEQLQGSLTEGASSTGLSTE